MTADDRSDEELTPEERSALSGLRRERQPPAGVEARVLRAVGARDYGWRFSGPSRRPIYAALAASTIFLLGLWLGASRARRVTEPTAAGLRFMLLLYEDERYRPAQDPAARVREYSAWAASLAQAGRLVAGDELGAGGVALTAVSPPLPLGPDQTRDEPNGFFVIVAEDEAAASRIAATCPHVRYGGRVVVRRIVT